MYLSVSLQFQKQKKEKKKLKGKNPKKNRNGNLDAEFATGKRETAQKKKKKERDVEPFSFDGTIVPIPGKPALSPLSFFSPLSSPSFMWHARYMHHADILLVRTAFLLLVHPSKKFAALKIFCLSFLQQPVRSSFSQLNQEVFSLFKTKKHLRER